MTNVTLTIDAEVLKRARMRALEEDTSVNAVVRNFLEKYAAEQSRVREEAARRILESSRASTSGSGVGGRVWKREDAYEGRV